MASNRRNIRFTVFKPNLVSLGYALFLAINAAGVWGGVFPFLPFEFQTPQIVFWFFLGHSLVLSFVFILSSIGSYFLPQHTRRFLVLLASAPYFLGWCFLIAAIYIDEAALQFVVIGGMLLGLGSGGFFMLWQRLFASQSADEGNRDLLVGTTYGALMYFALYLIPQALTAFLIPLVFLPLFALCVTIKSRTIDLKQPMFDDIPREHPHVYKQVIRDYWRSALCVGAIGFCTGIMRSITVAKPSIGIYINVLSMIGMLVAAIVVIWFWSFKNIRLSITETYKILFPFLITSFVGLPILPAEYARWLAAIMYAVYSAAIVLMMMQCAQASRDRGINPIFIYGFFGAVVYTLHNIGFLGGTFGEEVRIMGLAPLAVVAIVAIWALGMMHFIGSGGFGSAIANTGKAEPIELMSLRHLAHTPKSTPENINETTIEHKYPDEIVYEVVDGMDLEAPLFDDSSHRPQDRLSLKASKVQSHYRLTDRESEVMELIARGNSVARIAEMLVVSENTIRTHSKRIYTKLDVHKRQELIDLIESF